MKYDDISLKIILELFKTKSIFTCQELADKLKVSEKTIRRRINYISTFENQGFTISLTKGTGINFKILDETLFKSTLRINNYSYNYESPMDRQAAIFEKLFDATHLLQKENLLNTMFISESTLNNDIYSINLIAKKYQTCIKYTKNQGYFVDGPTYSKRILLQYFIEESSTFYSKKSVGTTMFHTCYNKISEILVRNKLYGNTAALKIVTNYLLLTLGNIKIGKIISNSELPDEAYIFDLHTYVSKEAVTNKQL